jgi:hypothetical protein
MNIEIRWQNEAGKWEEFDLDSIYWHTRDYAIALFSFKVPVIIKQNSDYVVNTEDLYNQYKQAGRNVTRLAECKPSTRAVIDAGFLKGA